MRNYNYKNEKSFNLFNKLILSAIVAFTISPGLFAQISGSKSIPSVNYPTIKVAVDSLNLYGVAGGGGVTFNVAAAYTETLSARLNLTATGTITDPIIFQKSGAGANPLLTAYTGTAAGSAVAIPDGMWALVGSDYVTIDGIDLNDPNTVSATTEMEYGYGLFKASGVDGANNNTIKNCVITLNRNNNTGTIGATTGMFSGSNGIVIAPCLPTTANAVTTVTSAAGASSNNHFYTNTIQNVNCGISMTGFAGASPFTLCDFNNDIGGTGASTGNNIINFGGGTGATNACAAVFHCNQWSANISYNTINNNNGSGINHPTTNRGIFLFSASVGASCTVNNNNLTIAGGTSTSAIDWGVDCEMAQSGAAAGQVISISNNTISMTKTVASTVAFTAIWVNSAATTVNVSGNTVNTFIYGGTGVSECILSQLAGIGTLNINNNNFSGVSMTGATGSHYNIGVTATVVTALNINGNVTNGVTLTGVTSKIWRGVYISTAAATCAHTVNSNTFQNISYSGGTPTGEFEFIYAAGSPASWTINSNSLIGSLTIPTTGTMYFIYNSQSTSLGTVSNNNLTGTGVTRTGASGATYGYYNASGPTGTFTFSGNTYSNINQTTSSGLFYGIYLLTSTSCRQLVQNNTYTNISSGSGTLYGINHNYGNTGSEISGNTITALTGTGTVSGINIGSTASITLDVFNNTVSGITTTGASTVAGIAYTAGTTTNIYKNKIYNINANNAGATAIGLSVTSGTTTTVYNNLVGDLKTNAALTGANQIIGISLTGSTTINAYYNTVYLNATTVGGANFGSSAISVNTTPTTISLRNNIFVNNSTPTGTGLAVAYRRASTALTNYSSSSNNNLFYAGTPSASKLIFYDGTNSDQSVMAYKIRVFPIDANSGTENPTFLSTVGLNANFLHIDPATATNIESGAANISGITDDYDSQTRQGNGGYVGTGTAPDIGADEFGGTPAVALAPPINFTFNTATTSSFNITWDDNSVNEAGFVVYRSLNPGGPFNAIIAAVVSTTPGTTGTTYTLPQAGLLGNTTYYYQIVANNFSNSAPLSGSASTLPCGSGLAGTYLIPGAYPSISAAITALQTNGLSAPVILELDPTYVGAGETYPLTFGSAIGCLGSSNTLTLRPATTVSSPLTITSANTTATIDINGGNFVTIDGRPGGLGTNKYLIVENTSTTAASAGNAIIIRNEASNNTVTYTEVRSANANIPTNTAITTAGSIPGAIAIGTTGGGFGNDNNTISFCNIHSLSSGGDLGACIYSGNATAAGSLANNDNNAIDNNNIYDFFLATSASAGVDVSLGNNSWTITNNHVYQTGTRNYTANTPGVRGFWVTPNTGTLTSASGFTISGNYIGGNASNGTGAYTMTGTVNYTFRGMDISVGLGTATSIQNNTLTNWNITGPYTGNSVYGIDVNAGNANIGTVTGNLVGSTTTNGSITVTTTVSGGSMIGLRSGAGGTINFSNNTVGGIDMIGNATTIATGFNGIAGSGGANIIVNNNTVGSATLANSINMVSTSSTSTNAASVRGIINNSGTAGVVNTITNNLVANINSNNNATGSQASTLVGISVTLGTSTISGNTVRNLTTAGQTTAGAGTPAVIGIAYTSATAPSLISNNTIHTLKATNPSTTAAIQTAGIYFSGPSSGSHIIERNFIHSISIASPTNSAGFITGIDLGVVSGVTITVKNNMIRLGYDETGASVVSPCTIRGITKNVPNSNIWFNSIYVGGTGVGTTATNTFCLARSAAATDDWRNNILVNNRSNATTGGKHYAINLNATTTLTLNYNDYYGIGTGYVFGFNGTSDVASYATNWISGDANSYNLDPLFINPTGTSTTVDLHIDPINATIIESTGIAIGAVTNDFDNQTRSALTPTDIGADAGNFVNLLCNGTPPASTAIISGSSTPLCLSGTKTLTLSGFAATPGMTFQWQESSTQGGPYVNVTGGSGGTTISFTTPTITQTMYYICVVTCSNGGAFTPSSEVAVIVNNPQVVTTTPGSTCGPGTVTLCATGSANTTLSWYTAPTGGTQIAFPYANIPVTGFNNDIVASGIGSNSVSGITYPGIGVDGANYYFMDNTYKYVSTNAFPTCFMPVSNLAASAQTPGLTYQFQSYTANNALTIDNNSTTYLTSPFPNSGTLTLTTPASYGTLKVLYETVANVPTTGFTVDALVTFTDATTQSFLSNNCVNWFTTTLPAYSGMGRGTPSGAYECSATVPNLFELSLPISSANYAKQVQSITFTIPTGFTSGTTAATVNYFHAMAVGGTIPPPSNCYTTPVISSTTPYYVQAAIGTCINTTRTLVNATVTSPPALTVSANQSVCADGVATLNVTTPTGNYTTYNWSPITNLYLDPAATTTPYSGTGNPTTLYFRTSTPGVYPVTLNATDGVCNNIATSTVTVDAYPTITSAVASPNPVCAGSSTTLTALTGSTAPFTGTIGTAASSIAGNDGNPYRSGNGAGNQIRTQLLYTAAELTAAGFSAGTITSIGFTTTAASTGAINNLQIDMGSTNVTALTATFETSPVATVFTQATFTPLSAGLNTHVFNTGSFTWNGTSNILINICQTNTSPGGTATVSAFTPSFASNTHRATSTTSCTTTTGTAVALKPMITIGGTTGGFGAGTYNWQWNPGAINGNVATVTPPVGTTIYTVSATTPISGCSTTATVSVTVNALPPAPTGTASTQCGLAVPGASVTSTSGLGSPVFKWYSAVTGGTLLQNSTSTTYTSTISATTTFYVSEVNANGCESSPRTQVIANVIQPDEVTITSSADPSATICLNQSVTLTAAKTGSTNNYTYTWSGTAGSGTVNGTTGNSITVTPNVIGTNTYTVTAVDGACTFIATKTITVLPLPTISITTASPSAVCAGTGVTVTALNAVIGAGNIIFNDSATTSTTYSAPWYSLWSNKNQQIMILASELTAAGISPGNLTGVDFSITAGTIALTNFSMAVAQTTQTTMATPLASGAFTSVFSTASLSQVIGNQNITFTTPFNWDGTSNIVLKICFGNPASTVTLTSTAKMSATSFVSQYVSYNTASPGTDGNALCGITGPTTLTYSTRPTMRLYGQTVVFGPGTLTWSWSNGTSIVSSTNILSDVPPTTTTYTVTGTNAAGCTATTSITFNVNPLPSAPTAINNTRCGFGLVNIGATSTSGAATPVLSWYTAASGGIPIQTGTSTTLNGVSIGTTTTYYVTELNPITNCESSPRSAVVQTVTPTDPLTITGGVSSICLGTTLNFGSTQTGSNQNYTLTWTASPAVGSGLPAGPLGPVQNWYTNTFTSGTGTGVLSGNASLTGGKVQLTPNTTSQAGALTIPNPTNIAADALQVNFDLTLTQTGPDGADGLSYSFGDDVSATATVPNFENGTGTKLKVSFDSYGGAGAGQAGIYLMYNCNVANQTPTTSGVLAYIPNVSFVNTTTAVSITVTQAGLATVSLNGTPVISNIALPSGYLTSNRSTWQHVFKARTGTISQIHAIDNLVINYQNTVSTPVSGSTLSVTPTLAGTYTYTLTGIDGGCAFQTAQTVLVNPAAAAINAGPDLSTCSNTSVTLSASGSGLIPALRFTEVLWQVNAGTGPTGASIPAWTSTWYTANGGTTMDMIEITNLGSGLAGSEGITIEMWNAASTTSGLPAYIYTIPAGAPVMNSGGLLYFTHSGATVVTDFTNNFYARGGTSIDNGSGTAAGMIMRKGSVIIDAVAVSGYTFPAASGVTASDWSGTLASNTGLSGTVLVAADNNTASCWANTSASQLASIGTLNAGLVANLPSLGTVSWTSIPSGFTANSATATFGPLTTTTSFIVQFNNGTCSSYDTAIVNVFAVIPTPLIATNLDTICASGTATLTVTNSISTATYQWSSSPSGLPGTFTNISGATGTTYTTPGLTLGSSDTTLYYQVSGTCGSTPSTSATRIIYVSNPRVSAISNGTRCGLGTVNLAATPSAGASLNWYANATGGTSLGNGNTFITPVINATTNFYVSSSTLSTEIAGKPAPTSTENIVGNQPLGVSFNVISKPATIKTVKIYSVGAAPGSLYVELWNSAGTVLNTAGPFTYGAGSTANPTVVTLPLNFIVPVGTNYRLVTTQMSGGSLIRESAANNTFPYVSASGNISVTSGYILSSGTSATYYYLYNWQVQSLGCESARTAVVATVTPPPVVNVSPSTTICESSSTTLTASSTNDPNYTYTWNPGGFVGANYLVTPAATTTYTLTALDNSGGPNNSCQDIKTVTISINQRPVISNLTSSPAALCQGDSAQISLSTTPFIAPTFGGSFAFTSLTGQTYSTLSGPGITVINTAAQLTAGMGSGAQDDGGVVITLPFTFNYNGNSFTEMSMCTNGWVGCGNWGTIDALSMRQAANLFTSTIPNNTLAAWFKDMGANFPTGSGSMRHGLIGTGVYAFQWDNAVGSGFSDGSTNTISFQINIYGPGSGSAGRIEYIYGPQTNTLATAAAIGIEDAIGGTDHYINALTGTGNATTLSSAWPGNGNGYRFAPLPPSSLTYSWSPSTGLSSTSVQNPKAAPNGNTVYTVTVNETGTGCSRTATLNINVSARPLPFMQEGDSILCSNDQGFYMHVLDNSAYIGGYPAGTQFDFYGAGGILYQSSTDNSFFNANNSDAFYAVVTLPGYLGSCTAISDTSVMDFGNTQAPQYLLTTDSVRCYGESNGKAMAEITFGGTPRFRWQWYNSSQVLVRDVTGASLSDTLSGMPEGMYTIVITDHQDSLTSPYCSITDSIFIGQPAAPLDVAENTGNHVDVLCNGALTGAIDIDVSGGTETYSYNWSNSAVTEDLAGIGAGTYTCTVTDSRGCTVVITRTITEPTALALNETVNQVQCNGGTGSVILNVTGGVASYSYEWSNSNSTASNTGLTSGTYTVTVTDGNGCTKSATFVIDTEPTAVTANCSSTPVSCFGGNNGTVGVTAGGGTPGYTYSWSNGSTSASQTSLVKGIYTVIVTDSHGCTASCSTTITQPTQLAVTTVAVNPTSGLPNSGTINVNATGGTPSYSYVWNNGSTVQNRTGLSAGTYTVTVTDANGCSASRVVTLTYTCQLGYINTIVTKPSCGKDNGVATVTGTGGTGYTYAWQTTPVQTTATATGLSYYFNSYVIITDVTTGCSILDTVVKPTSNGLTLTLTSPAYAGGKNIRCYGETNGSISLTVSGSTGPYTYLWNTGATTQNLTGVGAGTYIVTVSNGGCTNSNLITLTQPAALVATTTGVNVTCSGGSNGSATVTASGGSAPYNYSWNTSPVKTSATATGLTAGTYIVTVSDANGCTKTAVVTLTQPATGVSVSGVVTNVNCNGGTTGSIDITPSGGTPAYTYLWTGGVTTQDRINALAAGTYTVTVTDSKGCTGQYSNTITQPTAITATATTTNVNCNGGSNGTGSVTASGGTPPYTYSWNTVPPKSGANVNGIKKGTYTVIITDSKGCVKALTVTITEPAAIVIGISKTNVTTAGGSNGTATANVSGGVAPYSYSWNTVPVKTTQAATGLIAGTYTVTVTDANGCTKTASVVITQPTARMADGTQSDGASNSVVFPNPSTGKFTVTFDETIRTDVNLQVINMTGERVFMKDFDVSEQSSSFNIDLGALPKGIYFIRYRTNEKDWIDKLVIR